MRREYGRKYKAENKDKINKRRRKYRAENKDKINENQRKWNDENRDKIKQYNIDCWEKKASVTESVTDNKATVTNVTNVTTCLECGKVFSKKANAKFCSDACKQRYYRKKKIAVQPFKN